MNFRTDLALELHEALGKKENDGLKYETYREGEADVTKIEVLNGNGAKTLQKPIGKYTTVEIPSLSKQAQLIDDSLETVAKEIRELLPENGSVLVAGLGNLHITPDALGPKCSSMVLATRHISGEIAKSVGLGELRSVSSFSPGVLGETGVETGEVIAGLVQRLHPDAVITVDALAARKLSRLGCTIQMCDSGIVPGSGVGNARQEISSAVVGVPVISIGVPTVVDAATLAHDVAPELEEENDQSHKIIDEAREMMVTPREIDMLIERASKLVALAINRALQPHISAQDMLILTA